MAEDGQDLFSWGAGRGAGAPPATSPAELDLFLAALGGRRWQTAAKLAAATRLPDRKLRALAAESGGRIISGQKGYCLISEATPEEIHHAWSWLESQAKQMLARAVQIRRQAHHLIS